MSGPYDAHVAADVPPKLGRYCVRAKIGEGGMAAVYLGRSAEGEIVALKVIKPEHSLNSEFRSMLMDEAKIVSRLRHPNIVRVHDLGAEGTSLFMAMELLFGQSLWHVWAACRERGVRLPYEVAAWIGARAADGLHHAHELLDESGASAEVVHRDVNATNIFVTYDGEVKVIDFGLAKAVNRTSRTAVGIVKGKLAYMAPEQAEGRPIDRRADVFALGITLWEMTCDRRLFHGDSEFDTLLRVHAANVPDPTSLIMGYPPSLWRILQKSLAREPGDRHDTAAELSAELYAFSQTGARGVDAAVVAETMRALFAEERDRHEAWLAEASAPDQPAPQAALHPFESSAVAMAAMKA